MAKRAKKTLGVIGIPKLTRALKNVRGVVDTRVVMGVYLTAAKALGRVVQANAPRGTEPNQFPSTIREAVEVGIFKKRRNLADAAFVRINPGKAPHALWMEFGTAERKHKRTGKSVGSIQATNFFAKSKNAARPAVRSILFAGINGAIKRTWNKSGG